MLCMLAELWCKWVLHGPKAVQRSISYQFSVKGFGRHGFK